MKAIIVDDEPKAIDLLKGYLQHFSGLQLVNTFRNGLKAFEFLSKEKVDLVFLDINMPHISGISLSKMINPETKIIFTTAYSEFAVESYEVQAVDYLLKPISLERFTKAMSKILSLSKKESSQSHENIILLKSGTRLFRVDPNDILYLEKSGNYMTYHLKDQKILARESVQEALEALPGFFIQTHKSYIINIKIVSSLDKEDLNLQNTRVPIGSSYKEKLLESLKA